MSYPGDIENGQVVATGRIALPDGTLVRIEPEPAGGGEPTLANRFGEFIGIVDDLPADYARNHDHYLHGTTRK